MSAPFTSTTGRQSERLARKFIRRYRCVYCRRGVKLENLPSHEAQCDARFIVTRGWQMTIDRARQRERNEAALGAYRR